MRLLLLLLGSFLLVPAPVLAAEHQPRTRLSSPYRSGSMRSRYRDGVRRPAHTPARRSRVSTKSGSSPAPRPAPAR